MKYSPWLLYIGQHSLEDQNQYNRIHTKSDLLDLYSTDCVSSNRSLHSAEVEKEPGSCFVHKAGILNSLNLAQKDCGIPPEL